MSPTGKWIEGTHPEQHTADVVRRAVAERFDVLQHYSPLAAKKPAEEIEYVHQLRIATRRAKAALQIFADFVPRRRRRAVQKQLRRLRQAAGDARDLDVLGERLQKIVDKQKGSHLRRVLVQVADRRRKAQKPLADVCKRLKRNGFREQSAAIIDRIRWLGEGDEPHFAETARTALRPLVEDFFASAADLSDIESLHRMRICAKHVRYAMELLVGAFDPSFRGQLYPVFEEVQEKLGEINDHATAKRLFATWSTLAKGKTARDELSRLVAREEERIEATSREFRDWWSDGRSVDLLHGFEDVLPGTASKVHFEPESVERTL